MVDVVWYSWWDSPHRGYWDQTFLDWLFAQDGRFSWTHHIGEFPPPREGSGIVLVTPGHWRDASQITEDLRPYAWVLMIVTSDEEGECPFWAVRHPQIATWKQTPRQDSPHQPDRPLLLGPTSGTIEANTEMPTKDLAWAFAGQSGPEGNRRRAEAIAVMEKMENGELVTSAGFTQGLDRDRYFSLLRRARMVPAPSGPNIPDTFRVYEALESGAVPAVDAISSRRDRGYWGRVFPTPAPFPVIEDWSTLPQTVAEWTDQEKRVGVLAWWEQTKAQMVSRLEDDVAALSGLDPPRLVQDQITVIVTASPIPSHPSTEIISETMDSIRALLPDAPVIICLDGVRPELEHRREAYAEFCERLIWRCRAWDAVPIIFSEFTCQANMTRRALSEVRTELVLFSEHDTPLTGEIPIGRLSELVLGDYFSLIRFHHEHAIPREHQYLMRAMDNTHRVFDAGPKLSLLRTLQWSQRPHLARTPKYREWIDLISPARRTLIEDALYPLADESWQMAIYHPTGSIKRSYHLDGRAGDPKFDDTFG